MTQAQPRMIERIDGGWRIKTQNGYHVDVMIMLYNYRVVSTPVDFPIVYERGFCFAGRNEDTLLRAVTAALVWDPGDPKSEPPGWNKNAVTGEWRAPQ